MVREVVGRFRFGMMLCVSYREFVYLIGRPYRKNTNKKDGEDAIQHFMNIFDVCHVCRV